MPTNHPIANAFNRRLSSPLLNLDLPSSLSSSFLLLETQPPRPRPRPGTLERHRPLLSTPYHSAYSRERVRHHPSAVRHAPHCTASTRPRCLCFDPAQNYDSSPAHVPPSHTTQLSCRQRANPSKLLGDQFLYLCTVQLSLLGERPPFICERPPRRPPLQSRNTPIARFVRTQISISHSLSLRAIFLSSSPRAQRHCGERLVTDF